MDRNEEGLEHLFDEENAIHVEMQPKDIVHVSEHAFKINDIGGPRSVVWLGYLIIPASEFEDRMK